MGGKGRKLYMNNNKKINTLATKKNLKNTDFEVHKKNDNYTKTDFRVCSISQIQFTIEYHIAV